MPYDDPDPTDPEMLIGMMLPAGPETMREMAYVFAEEFARIGCSQDEILRMFRNPSYVGAHVAWRGLGGREIDRIVTECVSAWRRARAED